MAHTDSTRTDVIPAVRTLLADAIDYAGLFPPASLALEESIRNYAAYRGHEDEWMLGRFVCPAVRLNELRTYEEIFAVRPPLRLSVLGGQHNHAASFLSHLSEHIDSITALVRDLADGVRIEAVEMRLPGDVLSTDVITIRRFLNDLDNMFRNAALHPIDLFLEIPLDEDVRQTLPMVAGAVHALNREQSDDHRGAAGLKLRTGGTEAAAIPSSRSLAFAILTCRTSEVRFKATAGLHHPLRHHDSVLDTEVHGFLNLFVASVLASAVDIEESQIHDILSETSADAFEFTEDGLLWRGRRAGIEAIERARRRLIVSFGSCSFEEPTEDLRRLGLI